ncbi:replication protein A 70 kDa DNA-binding subunit C-like protein [Tanacetum coccineum]
MATKATDRKSDVKNKQHMSGEATCSKHTTSNATLEIDIEIILDCVLQKLLLKKRTYLLRTNHLKSGSKNLDFHLANHRQREVNQTYAMGKPRGDKVYLSSTSSTMIVDDSEIPTIKALKNVNSSAPRYRLELDVSDDTAQIVVVMFDETATALVGCSAGSLMDIEDEMVIHYFSLVIEDFNAEASGDSSRVLIEDSTEDVSCGTPEDGNTDKAGSRSDKKKG